ncbi:MULTISPECIES: ferredoxin reductase family protein [Micromonospora]|uniref:ferredoxin reductase family protein n=1 Tax=Micromonospora TaxID=1873 RepID=UPI00098D4E0B|nr:MULTISPECIES: ferredoxin reductase family protein [unclassified Micromonospora]MDI5941610.1 ferredoxin reductase family protein [Micromonospora sp. DH15]OON28771.1 oxidoreductase [Micromonospora sp. Rc5]
MSAAVAERPAPARLVPPGAPGWWADVAGVAAALSLLVVTALWTADRGVQELLSGVATGLTSAGRLTGLLSADLMLIQVVLMARVPLVERRFGQDRIARWHRLAGFASFHLLLAHVALTTIGYAGTAREDVVTQFWLLVTGYPGMLLATAALGLLVLVVVTSVRAARRRLRYESWHLLHLYAYLGIALALPHQLWTGADFVASPVARAYWWTAYLLALGSVLVFRLGLPAWRSLRHRVEVAAVVPEAPGVTSVWLRGRDLHRLPVRAGQFFSWRFLDGPGWSRAHPYSLSAPPSGDLMRITVKDLGDGSARVAALRPGTRVLLEGPYGRLTGEHWRGGGITMFACGVGVTPLLALLWELPYAPGQAVLLYRARTEEEIAFRAELDRLAAERGVVVHHLVGPRAGRPAWLPAYAEGATDAEALRRLSPDIADHDVFLCGPDGWVDAARAATRAAGVPDEHTHHERFAW